MVVPQTIIVSTNKLHLSSHNRLGKTTKLNQHHNKSNYYFIKDLRSNLKNQLRTTIYLTQWDRFVSNVIFSQEQQAIAMIEEDKYFYPNINRVYTFFGEPLFPLYESLLNDEGELISHDGKNTLKSDSTAYLFRQAQNSPMLAFLYIPSTSFLQQTLFEQSPLDHPISQFIIDYALNNSKHTLIFAITKYFSYKTLSLLLPQLQELQQKVNYASKNEKHTFFGENNNNLSTAMSSVRSGNEFQKVELQDPYKIAQMYEKDILQLELIIQNLREQISILSSKQQVPLKTLNVDFYHLEKEIAQLKKEKRKQIVNNMEKENLKQQLNRCQKEIDDLQIQNELKQLEIKNLNRNIEILQEQKETKLQSTDIIDKFVEYIQNEDLRNNKRLIEEQMVYLKNTIAQEQEEMKEFIVINKEEKKQLQEKLFQFHKHLTLQTGINSNLAKKFNGLLRNYLYQQL